MIKFHQRYFESIPYDKVNPDKIRQTEIVITKSMQ